MKHRRHAMTIALLLLILAAIGFLGSLPHGPDEVEAKVFERLLKWTAEMPAYDFAEEGASKARKTVINGNTVWLKVAASHDNIDRILDFYTEQYPAPRVAAAAPERLAALARAPGGEDIAESARLLTEFVECLDGQFRMERPHWGVWGAFVPHDEALRFGGTEYAEAYAAALEKGTLGEMGTARIVLAMKPPQSSQARIFNLWTTRDFDINAFQAGADGDLGGRDIDDVDRFPSTRRLLSLEQHNARTTDTVVVYEGGGSIVQMVLYFNSRMSASGWQSDSRLDAYNREQRDKGSQNGQTLLFTRDNRECVIQIHRGGRSGEILTTIIDRTTRAS